MKKWIAFGFAVIFTVLAISLAWMRIGGNSSISYVHITIPVILGALCVKIYRKYKKAEQTVKCEEVRRVLLVMENAFKSGESHEVIKTEI